LRAALYPRASGEKQVREGYGFSYQETDLRRFADEHGFDVVKVVTEPAFERSEFHRPGLARLRELAKSGEIDCVLAWKRDRYFGDPGLRAMFEREMELYGVRLLAMDDSGGDRPGDRFSDGIKDLLAQLEVAKTRERTMSGSLQKVREGKVIIGRRVNYGFAANATRDGYVVDEASAALVRRIFSLVAGGASLNATVATLNKEAIPSPTGRV
jgi:site-specific DNA recombinase